MWLSYICYLSLESNFSNNHRSQQYELNSKINMLTLTQQSDVVISTIFFLNYYSYFLSVRFLRNPSRNIHGRDPHFTYHVILSLPLFAGLVGPLMDDNGITGVLYVHNDYISYKQSAFTLNRPSVPVNSDISC